MQIAQGLQFIAVCRTSGAMALTVIDKIRGAWAVARRRYDQKIDSDLGLWQGRFFAAINDHGLFRYYWHNEGTIAPGLYRSNHPHAAKLADWKARGVVTIISLRPSKGAVHTFEAEAAASLGMRLQNVPFHSRAAPKVASLLRLLEVFETLERPALIHCKSGADRTGLAAALWAIHIEGAPVSTAKQALSLRFLHIRWSNTGVLDRFLEAYETRLEQGHIPLKDWIATEYDPAAI